MSALQYTSTVSLEPILGTDKRNPVLSVWRDQDQGKLYLFYGMEVLEVVPDERNHPRLKLMVAQLFNAKVKATTLTEVFGFDRKTMQSWGQALLSGDPQRLVQALEGRGARRKLTTEVRAFVRFRFEAIYPEDKATYSKRIRQEILEVFGKSVSSEALRPLFNELKAQMQDQASPQNEADPQSNISGQSELSPGTDSSPEDPSEGELESDLASKKKK